MWVGFGGEMSNKPVKHTHAPPGKRVLVRLHDGTKFVAKYKGVEGRFHYFTQGSDIVRVKSSEVYQVSILTADYKEV